MSEEEETVQEEEQPQETQEGGNKIFDALYNAATEEEEEESEEFVPPSSLQSALHDIENEPEGVIKEEPVQEAAQQEEEAEKPKPKQKSRVKKKIVDPEFNAPAPQPQAPERKEDPFLKQLLPEEQDRYNTARWASENIEGKEGLAAEYLNFFKRHKSFINQNKDEHNDLAGSDEYKSFLKKFKPREDMRKIEREMLTQQAEKRALEKISPHLQQMQREQLRTQGEPKAKAETANALKDIPNLIPEAYRKEITSDPKAFASNNPLEAEIVQKAIVSSKSMIEEFNNIVHDVVDYDEKNPLHAKISDFITAEQTKFIKSGRTVKKGKTFIRRERMPQVPEAEKVKYYTFTNADIVQLIKMRAGQSMDKQIGSIHKMLERSGYVRGNQRSPQVVAPQQVAQQSPRVQAPSQRAGVAPPATSESTQKSTLLGLLDL